MLTCNIFVPAGQMQSSIPTFRNLMLILIPMDQELPLSNGHQ